MYQHQICIRMIVQRNCFLQKRYRNISIYFDLCLIGHLLLSTDWSNRGNQLWIGKSSSKNCSNCLQRAHIADYHNRGNLLFESIYIHSRIKMNKYWSSNQYYFFSKPLLPTRITKQCVHCVCTVLYSITTRWSISIGLATIVVRLMDRFTLAVRNTFISKRNRVLYCPVKVVAMNWKWLCRHNASTMFRYTVGLGIWFFDHLFTDKYIACFGHSTK